MNTTNCDGAKAHQSVLLPEYQRAFVMDLGSDLIYQYNYGSSTGGKLVVPSNIDPAVVMPEGSGPRHMVVHPTLNRAYAVCELSSTVTVLEFGPNTHSLTPISTLSTLRQNESSVDMAGNIKSLAYYFITSIFFLTIICMRQLEKYNFR